jgi:O-antigen/teichoic acid export membrane protein
MTSAAADASRQVLGRGSLYTLGTAGPILAGALVTPAITRAVDRSEYGVIATCVVVVQVLMFVTGLGLPSVITRHGLLERSGLQGAKALVLKGSAATVAFIAVLAATSPLWSDPLLHIAWRPAIAIAALGAAALAMVESALALLRIEDQPLRFVAVSAVGTLGGPVIGLALVHLGTHPSAGRYVTGLAVGYLLSAALGLWLGLRGRPAKGAPGDYRLALRTGLPAVPHQVSLYLAGAGLVVVANHAFGVVDGGRLSLALLVGSAAGVVTSALNNSWVPVVFSTPEAERGAVLERTGRDLAALTALASGGVAVLAPWLLRIAAPSRFDTDSLVKAVAITAAGSVLTIAYLANVHLVFASGRSTGLALVTPLSVLVGFAAAAALSTSDHLALVAFGFPVTYAALAIGTSVLRRQVSPTSWQERRLLPPIALGLALCAVGGLLPTDGPSLVLRGVLAVLLLVGAALVAGRVVRR